MDGYTLPKPLRVNVYQPYIESFRQQIIKLNEIGFIPQPQGRNRGLLRYIKRFFVGIQRQIWKFNIIFFGTR